jgi:4-oxalocrotonate tautomerase family enzyme
MPVITMDSAALAPGVKTVLIRSLTRAAAEATGLPEASFIVLLRDLPADAIGIGGVPLSERRG